jgi:tight adherence protein C
MDMLLIGILLALALGLVVYSALPARHEARDAVKRRLTGRRSTDEVAEIREQARQTATASLVKRATPVLSKIIMPTSAEEQSNLRARLTNAGFRHRQAQTVFLASKSVVALIGLGIGFSIAVSAGWQTINIVGATLFGGGIGFMLPNFWLGIAVGSRQQKVKHGLPDTLDLLVVSVESGLALDAALKRVGDEMAHVHPELSEEMRIATMEAQMGLPRSESLENMARRVGLEELGNLVSVIIQAERFGTSIARALRNQADVLRTKRRQAAEERAQKTAVKLLVPLVLFIFPALGIVVGGPAVLGIIETMKNNPSLAG